MSVKRYIAEFIGTFFLVLSICMTTFSKVSADLQPLAIGAMLIAMIYAVGHISGAHFNPAITLAFLLRGKIEVKDAGFYALAQILGGVAAALITSVLVSAKPPLAPFVLPPQYFSMIPALISELIGTFALAWVILNVASAKALEGNSFYGIAIGFVVMALIYTLGSVSSGIFNPAVAISTCVIQLNNWNALWIYLVGTFGGATLAALLFRFVNQDEQ